MIAALERGEWSAARPGRTLPPRKTRYPFYRRLGGPKGRSGRAEYPVPTGIRSRNVQPVVSRYTDWATRPTLHSMNILYFTDMGHIEFSKKRSKHINKQLQAYWECNSWQRTRTGDHNYQPDAWSLYITEKCSSGLKKNTLGLNSKKKKKKFQLIFFKKIIVV